MGSTGGVAAGLLVGVYYGLNMLQLIDPEKVDGLCSQLSIPRMRLYEPYEPNSQMLEVFIGNKDMKFTFGIPNKLLRKMEGRSLIDKWFDLYMKPYVNSSNIEYIVVGENGHQNILPIMQILRGLMKPYPNFNKVKLTTIVSYELLVDKDPPSKATFLPNFKDNMKDILNFLVQEGMPELMVSLYPFKKYIYDNGGKISIDFATFGGKDSIQDGPIIYTNLFDYMVDAVYSAIMKLGDHKLNGVTVVIGETGWPTGGRGDHTSVALASSYNQKVMAHMNSGKGTPKKPNIKIKGFIRSLFNEDKRPEGESRFYGFYNTNFTPIYKLF